MFCFALIIMPIRIKLREGGVVRFFLLSCKVMLGKFVRCITNFPALSNLVFTFHSFLYITRLGLSCGLTFNMKVGSVVLHI